MKSTIHKCLFLLVFGILITLPACSKSTKQTTIVGKVLTYGTEEIMDHPPVKVQLYRQDHAGCLNPNTRLLTTACLF